MVAILGLTIFLMGVSLLAAWATIAGQRERIAELEELHRPATTPPWAMIRAREDHDARDTEPDLPLLSPMEGNRDKTQVSRYT